MIDFILCIVQYVVIAIFMVAVAGLGIFLGIKKRKATDAKQAAATEE